MKSKYLFLLVLIFLIPNLTALEPYEELLEDWENFNNGVEEKQLYEQDLENFETFQETDSISEDRRGSILTREAFFGSKNNTYIYVILGIIIIALVLFFVFRNKNKTKENRRLKRKK